MRKIWKEITILLIQLFMFYIFPLFAGPTDIIGMVFLILVSTFILAIIFASISTEKWKYIYPIIYLYCLYHQCLFIIIVQL